MALSPPADVLGRTPVYRIVHIDCLVTLLQRGALHAPNRVPNDGLPYIGIHDQETQRKRSTKSVRCGPGGKIGDYVGFYFGPPSPMLYRVHTGWNVQKVDQARIIYLVSIAQDIASAGLGYVLTDRHSLTAVASFSDSLDDLSMVDFEVAYATRWDNTDQKPDRQERKQAEFLVHGSIPWNLIDRIGVLREDIEREVNSLLGKYPTGHRPRVTCEPAWYY